MTRINHSPYYSLTEVKYKPRFRLVPAVPDHVREEINDPENWAVKNRLLRKEAEEKTTPVFHNESRKRSFRSYKCLNFPD